MRIDYISQFQSLKRLSDVVLFVVLTATSVAQTPILQPAKPEDLKKSRTTLTPALVHIEIKISATTHEHPRQFVSIDGTGTGFFVTHDGDIVTAAHVVCGGPTWWQDCVNHLAESVLSEKHEHVRENPPRNIEIRLRYRIGEKAYSSQLAARVIAEDDKEDVAVLRPASGPAKQQVMRYLKNLKLPELTESNLAIGRMVMLYGFPLGVEDARYALGFLTNGPIADQTGKVSFTSNIGPLKVIGGYSGSPIVDIKSGQIIGIATAVMMLQNEPGGHLTSGTRSTMHKHCFLNN